MWTRGRVHTKFWQPICGSLHVRLYFDVLLNQGDLEGIYQSSYPVNGKPSWTSETSVIFYNPIYKAWAIGEKRDIGYLNGGINSLGDPEQDYPQNVVSWRYWSNQHRWVDSAMQLELTGYGLENDLIVECVEGKVHIIREGRPQIFDLS